MERLSETLAADVAKEQCPVSDSLSLPSSYKDYPAPAISTLMHHRAKTCSPCPPSPSKAFPETSSAEIFSALRNLQEKIRRLESEKSQAELSLWSLRKNASHRYQPSSESPWKSSRNHTEPKTVSSSQSNCNQVLITHLAAAESRCVKLERQLDHMRRMLRNARTERAVPLKTQEIAERGKSPHQLSDSAHEQIQLQKLERLEQEYQRLTRTQNSTEMKIYELELKLQEEETQRRLVQDKAKQLQTGLEANRLLLQAVSPRLSKRPSKDKKPKSKQQQQASCTQPHYRLRLTDVPFVTGTAVGCSHSVRANVQSVLSLLKQHQPHLCNSRVLSRNVSRSDRDSSSSSSSSSRSSDDELSELLHGLQEELRLMSLEQDELMQQLDDSVGEQERKALWREQEKLLLKMEMKGEQISKLYKHKSQIKKLQKEIISKPERGKRARVASTVSTRGHSTGVKALPGEKSKRNLRLLRDMKALQTSLQH